jgi:hypothetical protein
MGDGSPKAVTGNDWEITIKKKKTMNATTALKTSLLCLHYIRQPL